MPPLRDRQGDSLLLAQFLLQQISTRFGKPTRGLAPDAIRAIQAHRWPGNVRELENRITGAVIMAEGAVVTASDLGLEDPGENPEYLNLRVARQRAEAQAVRQSLAVAQGQPVAGGGAARRHAADALRSARKAQHRCRAVRAQCTCLACGRDSAARNSGRAGRGRGDATRRCR